MISTQGRLTVLIFGCDHGPNIRRAIESVLLQRISDPYTIIVAEKQENAAARSIVSEFMADLPTGPTVQFLDTSSSPGLISTYQRAFQVCQTEFVATLNGNDYWIHPDKLTEQMVFLNEHRECSAVSSNYFIYDENASRFTARAPPDSGFTYLDARSLIRNDLIGNLSACMYRMNALRSIPDMFYNAKASDWGINICVARYGFIGFLHKPASVRRIRCYGASDEQTHREDDAAKLSRIEHYDAVTDHVFADEFQALKDRLEQPAESGDDRRPLIPRIGAVLMACLPPFVLTTANWAGRVGSRFFLPPILPIAIKKLRRNIG